MLDDDMPKWAKARIAAALGYFIFPADAIPDPVPAVGYSDDLGALASALATVAAYTKEEHRKRAAEQLHRLFSRSPTQMGKLPDLEQAYE